jgi:hypothetical protein
VQAVVVAVMRKRKQRLRPPWGNILGGKPIERQAWFFNEKIDLGDEFVRQEQYDKMRRLATHYQIIGDLEYPVKGIDSSRLGWYQLALAMASDLDDSLRIVDAPSPAKTTARWRGPEGLFLLRIVDAIRKTRPKKSIRWCLNEFRKRTPGLAQMSLDQLDVRYHEARKHFSATEEARKQNQPS